MAVFGRKRKNGRSIELMDHIYEFTTASEENQSSEIPAKKLLLPAPFRPTTKTKKFPCSLILVAPWK